MSAISTTWYTWLEQGRDITVSAQTLSGIASALQLTPAEREYLFLLAHKSDPMNERVPAVEPTILATLTVSRNPAICSISPGRCWHGIKAPRRYLPGGWMLTMLLI